MNCRLSVSPSSSPPHASPAGLSIIPSPLPPLHLVISSASSLPSIRPTDSSATFALGHCALAIPSAALCCPPSRRSTLIGIKATEGWEEGKAHGHGICTGPDGQGEYAGAWHYGFEVSGVYTWPSGSQFAGQWQNGKRHGLGVEQRGRWLYKGEWTQGYKGRYGRREAINSVAHYLGTWSSGLHDGYGTEVYADGGSYKGQWLRGMRHGYGIRTSATWNAATKQRASGHSHAHASLSSLRSTYGSMAMDDETAAAMDTPNHTGRSHSRDRRGEEADNATRSGFVLRVYAGSQKRRRSLSERSLAIKRTILNNLRIRKQHSTGDIHQRAITAGASSLRSSGSTLSCTSDEDSESQRGRSELQAAQEEPPVDANAVEVYKGEWKNDSRSGYGICERSDGLKYAGEWLENKKHGFGITYFKDGTKEEGRYKQNVLITSTRRRGILFVRSSKLRERVELYAEHARRAADMAAQRVEIATSRTMTAQEKADASLQAADRARDDANTARIYAAQFDPSFKQPGVELLRRQRTGTPASSVGGGYFGIPVANHFLANHVSFDPASPSSAMAISIAEQPPQQPIQRGSSGEHGDSEFCGTAVSFQQQQRRHMLSQQHSTDSASAQSQSRMAMEQQFSDAESNVQQQGLPEGISKVGEGIGPAVASTSSAALLTPNSVGGAPPQQSSDNLLRRPHPGRGNVRTRGSSSTMSLNDDHWDQYLLKAARAGPSTSAVSSEQQNILTEARLRRNRPSLMRQCEVVGASIFAGSDSPESSAKAGGGALNRRSTLATAARVGTTAPIHSVYGADDSFRHEQTMPMSTDNNERGSLPNLDELANQPIVLPREEAARLASQRRLATQRLQEEEERLRQNPLRYLNPIRYPELRNWLYRWRVPLLLVLGNIILFYCFVHLLSRGTPNRRGQHDRKREQND
uniref:Junctophilin n=1 Tax=Globodera rostochiensis TaxID=31243 RepID=A0A914I891_GLORO